MLGDTGEPMSQGDKLPIKRTRHHILTQNLKALGSWITSLYKAFSSLIFTQCGTQTRNLNFSNNPPLKCNYLHIIMFPQRRKIAALAPPLEGVNGTHRIALP